MNDREAVAWLGRKIAWGFNDGQFAQWSELGPDAVIELLVNPDASGVPPRAERFVGIEELEGRPQRMATVGVEDWLEHAVTSTRPLETFMEFFWSGFFAVSLNNVRPRQSMFAHMTLLARHALGNFRTLLREVTVDAAMLDFLDGGRNTRRRPNENFARELLELYTVGVGHFGEDDVVAASRSLTGWKLNRQTGEVEFRSRLHDDSPQTLLGVTGVSDVDSTVDACLAHPAAAGHVVDRLATAILGPDYPVAATRLITQAFAADWELGPLVRGLLELGVEGKRRTSVIDPVAWYCGVRKAPLSPPKSQQLRAFFRQSGQQPLQPPNVGGFPDPEAYLSTSATLARVNIAYHLARRSLRQEANIDVKAMSEDVDALAERLGLATGFVPATAAAIESLRPGADRLAAALASPDLVVI